MAKKNWRKVKGGDLLSDCYLSPTEECIISIMLNGAKEKSKPKDRFSAHRSNIDRLVQINRLDLAKQELEKAKEAYYQLTEVKYDYPSLLRVLSAVGQKPGNRFVDHTYKKIRYKTNGTIDATSLLYAAQYFGELGYIDSATKFLMDVVDTAEKTPKILKYEARSMGRALAATRKHDLLKSYLAVKDYDSEWKSRMLEAAFTHYIKKEKLKDANEILKIIFTYQPKKTSKDDLHYIRMLKKMHQNKLTLKLTDKLTKQMEKMSPLFRGVVARSLVQAHGARGMIHTGRKVIDQHFSKNRLGPMLDLSVEATKSRTAAGLAVQYYRDMPKLIKETYGLLKQTNNEERKKNKLDIREFYEVMAADLGSKFSRKEFDAYGYDSFDYDQIIAAFIEVRKYDEALEWTVAQEKRFGKSYNYYDLFSMYGQAAPREKVEEIKAHPKFKEHGRFFNRAYLKRLFWNGHLDEAATLFKTLSDKEKRIMVINQLPFVSGCLKCDL